MADNTLRLRAVLDDKVSAGLAKIRDNVNLLGGKGTSASLFGNIGADLAARGLNLVRTAASGLVDTFFDSIKASSDLSETMSKARVVFGGSAKDIERFGDSAASALGLSKRNALEAAASFGNLFVGLDLGEKRAADMSQRLVALSADLASFNNIDPTEVLDKLRSGLAGEAEPLRRLGVFLSEAKVRAKAMELGLATAHGELSEGAKVLARYQLILDETKTAQGDFARTSLGLANQQRKLAAILEDANARFGKNAEGAFAAFQRGILAILDERFRAEYDYQIRRQDLARRSEAELARIAEDGSHDITQRVLARAEMMRRAGQDTSTDYVEGIRSGLVGGIPVVEDAADALGDTLPEGMEEGAKKAERIARRVPGQMAQAIVDGRQAYRDSWDTYLQALEDVGDKSKQIARLKSHLASDELLKGLKSKNPELRKAALDQQQIIIARWQKLQDRAFDWGKGVMVKFIKGMDAKLLAVDAAAERAAQKVSDNLRLRSPAKKGPMSEGGGPEGWGKRGAELYRKGWTAGLPRLEVGAAHFAGVTMGTAGVTRLGQTRGGGQPVVLQVNLDGREVGRAVYPYVDGIGYAELQRAAPTIGKV